MSTSTYQPNLIVTKSGDLPWDSEGEYEVEQILSHKRVEGVDHYLVKWTGWSSRYNSWESRDNLHCQDLIDDYIIRIKSQSRKRSVDVKDTILNKQSKYADEIFARLNGGDESHGNISARQLVDSLQLNGAYTSFALKLKTRINHADKEKKRVELKRSLVKWQEHLNSLHGYKSVRIFIENDVDLEGPPDNFEYVIDYRAGVGVTLNNDPVVGCDCKPDGCYASRETCCAGAFGHDFAYTKFGRLRVAAGSPIYECNKRCSCDADCPNRVVQNGQAFKLCIFRTRTRGWGVKALQKIQRGSFVMEYLGEIITPEEAERRGKLYDSACRTYLFDLDYNGDENPYTIDGGRYGNISHFVNHSCEPNVTSYCVWINNLDPNVPRIAFFSNRDIARGEEITVDYKMTGDTTNSGNVANRMLCQCGSSRCRGYLF